MAQAPKPVAGGFAAQGLGTKQDGTEDAEPTAQRLLWLTGARLVLYLVLLAATAVFYLGGDARLFPLSLRIVVMTLTAAFATSALYALWLRSRKALRTLSWVQVVSDQVLWTALVYLTGGPLSFGATFHGLACVLAAVTLQMRGAVASALLGGTAYTLVVIGFTQRWLVPPADQAPFRLSAAQVVYPTLVSLVGLFVVALLSGWLARRLATESGRLVEVTERAERAERLAALGRIAAALAHEIRNPLGSISGSIDLIREAPGLDADERRLCDIVRAEVNRLNDLVDDMMNLARPREPQIVTVDLARIAQDVVELARRSGRSEQDVPLTYQGPDNLDATVDGALVRQLVWNLVRNAVQASGADAPVQVRVSGGPEGGAVVEVIDHGPGIPDEMRGRIFDAFVTTRAQGVGIGLAVVKQIVEAHDARIEVLSPESGGTTFRVELPLREVSA